MSNPRDADRKLVRLNVNLNEETAAALKKMADDRGISFTEAIRRCISVHHYLTEVTESGSHVSIIDPVRNTERELVLL